MEGLVARRRTTVKSSKLVAVKKIIQSRAFKISVAFSLLGLCFVLVRMKRIEQDYEYTEISQKLSLTRNKIKEMKAKKAELLSIRNLRKIATKYKLKEPDHKHIIIIP